MVTRTKSRIVISDIGSVEREYYMRRAGMVYIYMIDL